MVLVDVFFLVLLVVSFCNIKLFLLIGLEVTELLSFEPIDDPLIEALFDLIY